MTVKTRWIRLAARWLARIDGVSGQLQLAMLALTGVSTATLTLKQYGHGRYAWPLILIVGISMPVYAWLYSEGGVWNQVERDKTDLSNNYAGPLVKIDDETIGAAVFAAIHGRPPDSDEIEAIESAVNERWQKHRHGIELE